MTYVAVAIEGGLFPPDLLERIATAEVEGQRPQDFGLTGGRLSEEIQSAFSDARAYWEAFQRRLRHSREGPTTVTREAWAVPLLEELGFALRYQPSIAVGGETFAISHRAGEGEDAPPVNIVSLGQSIDRRAEGSRRSPHAAVQEYLNRSDVVWGLVTNGARLRLLRHSARLARPTYLEFDLRAIVEGNLYSEFVLLYRLLHRSRFPLGSADADRCWLERYYQRGIEEGGRARERLREGVERALKELGNAFLTHPDSVGLVDAIRAGRLDALTYYRELLRLVYRLLFLMVVEERRLVFPPLSTEVERQAIYTRYYSVSRLRERAERASFDDPHGDVWRGLLATFRICRDGDAARELGLSSFDGELFATEACRDLENAACENGRLLRAIYELSTFADEGTRRRVNYAGLDVEEFGSVYESLLDYRARLETGDALRFELMPGGERRQTGSYYTDPDLVRDLVEHALMPVIEERLENKKSSAERQEALLSLRVCDPASGSGHFLLAAARRIARELARVRTGEDEPTPEAYRVSLRDAIRSCLYAVDKNPLAVDLCKVALWIEGHNAGLPLSFLDHRVKCGDSLVGVVDLRSLQEGIPSGAFRRSGPTLRPLLRQLRERNELERAGQQAHAVAIEVRDLATTLDELQRLPDDNAERVQEKVERYREARVNGTGWWINLTACHLWTVPFFTPPRNGLPTTAHLAEFLADPQRKADGLVELAWREAATPGRPFFHWPLEFPDVFVAGGFDVVLSNPPFMGGLKISENFGDEYFNYLATVFEPAGGTADLCAYFFRRGFDLLRAEGHLGMVATKTIGQGDTREAGLGLVVRRGGTITFARRYIRWPGVANVEVNLVAIRKGPCRREVSIDGKPVVRISSRLDDTAEDEPKPLSENSSKAFIGSYVLGLGFVLSPDEAEGLITRDGRNRECLFPYLNGEDINSRHDQSASRWVIQFDERSEQEARRYSQLWRIVEERVREERRGKKRERYRVQWWKHGENRRELYRCMRSLHRVFVRSRVSEMHALAFVPATWIYSEAVVVFAFDDDYHFAVLQSNVHEVWLRQYASTLRTDIRYTPTDCFENFPFPQEPSAADERAASGAGGRYHEHRAGVMRSHNLGLTKTYNLFHDPSCEDADIRGLREAHAEMDRAVLDCYGWSELDLQHGFHQNDRGQIRFTVSRDARREILRRLLVLNLEIAERERRERATPRWEQARLVR